MHVTVKLFATLSRFAQSRYAGDPFDMELREGATLNDLIAKLKIPPEETRVTFVNGLIQESDYGLKDGDEVGIFPPIGGG